MKEAELLRMICGRVERGNAALERFRRDVIGVVLLVGAGVGMTLATAAAMVGVMAALRDSAMSAEAVVGLAMGVGAMFVAAVFVVYCRMSRRIWREVNHEA